MTSLHCLTPRAAGHLHLLRQGSLPELLIAHITKPIQPNLDSSGACSALKFFRLFCGFNQEICSLKIIG